MGRVYPIPDAGYGLVLKIFKGYGSHGGNRNRDFGSRIHVDETSPLFSAIILKQMQFL
ncbi:hypothetical protein HanRHA438_Chr16g0775211 [Helianthus annuus]|nr:hypothetical protein HanRHA438_Chr16g0775211 [Helianthus annuus]